MDTSFAELSSGDDPDNPHQYYYYYYYLLRKEGRACNTLSFTKINGKYVQYQSIVNVNKFCTSLQSWSDRWQLAHMDSGGNQLKLCACVETFDIQGRGHQMVG